MDKAVISRADVRAVVQSLAAWIISLALVALFIILEPTIAGGQEHHLSFGYTVPQAVSALVLVVGLLLILVHYVRLVSTRPRTYPGRENAQGTNCEMVRRFCVDREADDFLSTRVTYWDLSEDSPSRLSFRSLITEKINTGFLVKRIWHISSIGDINRLRRYLGDYATYDNYHVKILTDLRYPIPELICVGKKFASITFPEVKSPRRMSLTIHFRQRAEIGAIRKYYDLLWELAEPVKSGPQINFTRLDELASDLQKSPS